MAVWLLIAAVQKDVSAWQPDSRKGCLVPANSFGRDKRLMTKADFDKVFGQATQQVGNNCLLLLSAPQSEQIARLGLVVAKKNLKTAVQRNRFKRLVREAFRHYQNELAGQDLVVLARPGFNTLATDQQAKLVRKSFRQLIKNSTGTLL